MSEDPFVREIGRLTDDVGRVLIVDYDAVPGLDEEAGAILRPLLDDLLAARDEDAAMALLGNAYPQLDSSLLEERLAQLMFAAELIGRISAADETKP